jgi:hypothetical protein
MVIENRNGYGFVVAENVMVIAVSIGGGDEGGGAGRGWKWWIGDVLLFEVKYRGYLEVITGLQLLL